MQSIDQYLSKKHDMKEYNCWDFIREVWLDITGTDIGHRTPVSVSREEMKERFRKEEKEFKRLPEKKDPCIVLMLRSNMLPHVGIYVRGRVLHLPEKSYTRFEPLAQATFGFKEVRFYET
jgi:hypothetical protein